MPRPFMGLNWKEKFLRGVRSPGSVTEELLVAIRVLEVTQGTNADVTTRQEKRFSSIRVLHSPSMLTN